MAETYFVATFHTHAGALKFERRLKALNEACKLLPVPRTISSSCGVCARFNYNDFRSLAFEDLDAVYLVVSQEYQRVWENEVC